MADGLPRFGGLDPEEFTADSVSRVLQRYTRDLTLEVERRFAAVDTRVQSTRTLAAGAEKIALEHASRHFAPGASGEDPIPIGRLQGAKILEQHDGAIAGKQGKADKDADGGFVGRTANGGLLLKVLTADPSSPADGEVWIFDDGLVRAIRVRSGGVTRQIVVV